MSVQDLLSDTADYLQARLRTDPSLAAQLKELLELGQSPSVVRVLSPPRAYLHIVLEPVVP